MSTPTPQRSEAELQSELEEASVRREILKEPRQCNLTTCRRIVVDAGLQCPAGSVAVWVCIRRCVEQIENIGAKLQRLSLADVKVLEQGHVDPFIAGTVDVIAAATQIGECCCSTHRRHDSAPR